jgi:hypothetical protein
VSRRRHFHSPTQLSRTTTFPSSQNFNLTDLREAQIFDCLTRITILLAKVTTVFLSTSLVTSQFSMQVPAL